MIFPLVLCEPITWSIDTTGVGHPGRTSVAVGRAFDEWQAATGLRFAWQPEGGQVGIVFRVVDSRWAAYSMESSIVADPALTGYAAAYQTEVLAHELGHALGVNHEGTGLMGGKTTHVTADDAALVRICGR